MMREHERYRLAVAAAEATYHLWELECAQRDVDLDRMMRRLKDLSAYSLTHAEVMDQREGVELLALAMLFGATSDSTFHRNQKRLSLLSEQAVAYRGQADVVASEVAERTRNAPSPTERRLPPASTAQTAIGPTPAPKLGLDTGYGGVL